MTGIKYDQGKAQMELLPPKALREVAHVLTFGAQKYAPDNWRKVKPLRERYLGAALRHIMSEMEDPGHKDTESGIDGLAHAICCLMFILENRLGEPAKMKHELDSLKYVTSWSMKDQLDLMNLKEYP